ncbi:uncharacterized protein [Oryza sativa Japonica Group]|uniref:uncharacterized protein n=1 Tax=Oryza sativa subsp. japonica TaxID=39947 RepID=UPI00077540E1|nr:bromodomain-containing protein DDB_G0270170 [Oryza sativa Japonica Group]KAF2937114.1 hypothetical protein DAI22_03g026300 [Oryza sativa Japonica Group]
MAKTRKAAAAPPPPPPPPPAETPARRKGKKKGRPSLLDLQRRSLRLQAQNPSPAPSPSRRDANPSDEDDDGVGSGGRRRQKRLKSVLSSSGGGEDDEAPAAAVVVKVEVEEKKKKVSSKATGKGDAASDGGPTTGTPLPDKKLLLFILDRLQKKDTYGVFSEPVDHEELPDYHEIIEHPMDFSTIREKLLNDSYTTLEQFENDVFLLTSNAMSYNSDDTVYYRQARSIEALAKKDFENLRQASEPEEEQQPKTVPRRGRPPKYAKKIEKTENDVSPDLSNAKTKSADHAETIRKRLTGDRTRNANITTRDSPFLQHNTPGSFAGKRTDRFGDYSGPSKYGKKTTPTISDDERRSTYDQQYFHSSPLFSALGGERKVLVPVGLQQQHAYARSLARFAAKFGPVGWDIAAKRIRRLLPSGTNFGPGWVVDGEPPENSQWPRVPMLSDPSIQSTGVPASNVISKNDESNQKSGLTSNEDSGEEHLARTEPVASTSACVNTNSVSATKLATKCENGANVSCDGVGSTGQTPPLQQHSHSREIHSNMNGFTALPNTISQYAGQGFLGQMQLTHAQVLGMFSGVNGRTNGFIHGHPLVANSIKAPQNGDVGKVATNPSPDAGHDSEAALSQTMTSSAPSLSAGVQPSGSMPSEKLANPKKHPDLALQL